MPEAGSQAGPHAQGRLASACSLPRSLHPAARRSAFSRNAISVDMSDAGTGPSQPPGPQGAITTFFVTLWTSFLGCLSPASYNSLRAMLKLRSAAVGLGEAMRHMVGDWVAWWPVAATCAWRCCRCLFGRVVWAARWSPAHPLAHKQHAWQSCSGIAVDAYESNNPFACLPCSTWSTVPSRWCSTTWPTCRRTPGCRQASSRCSCCTP